MSNEMLIRVLDELKIPYTVVGGSVAERLRSIAAIHDLPTLRDVDEAITLAEQEYAHLDVRSETQRVRVEAGR